MYATFPSHCEEAVFRLEPRHTDHYVGTYPLRQSSTSFHRILVSTKNTSFIAYVVLIVYYSYSKKLTILADINCIFNFIFICISVVFLGRGYRDTK